jgi:hypothetical protein
LTLRVDKAVLSGVETLLGLAVLTAFFTVLVAGLFCATAVGFFATSTGAAASESFIE